MATELYSVNKSATSGSVTGNYPSSATIQHVTSTTIATAAIELVNQGTSPHHNALRTSTRPDLTTATTATLPEPFSIGATTLNVVCEPTRTDPPVIDECTLRAIRIHRTATTSSICTRVLHSALRLLDITFLGFETTLGNNPAQKFGGLFPHCHCTRGTADISGHTIAILGFLRLEASDLVESATASKAAHSAPQHFVTSNHFANGRAEECSCTLCGSTLDLLGLSTGILHLSQLHLLHRFAGWASELPAEELSRSRKHELLAITLSSPNTNTKLTVVAREPAVCLHSPPVETLAATTPDSLVRFATTAHTLRVLRRLCPTTQGDVGTTTGETNLHLFAPVIEASTHILLLDSATGCLHCHCLHAGDLQSTRPALWPSAAIQSHLSFFSSDLRHGESTSVMNVEPVSDEWPAVDIIGA